MTGLELLTTPEMAAAERRAVERGVPMLTLMENAGRAVADEAAGMVQPRARIAVLCGPGNNGGDGFVAARLLQQRGFDVHVLCLRDMARLKGDAAVMAGRWNGPVRPLTELHDDGNDDAWALVVDAIFGSGLSRPYEPETHRSVMGALVAAAKTKCLAVDVPSGLDASTGLVPSATVRAMRTVTFFRRKVGHVLLPGRWWCGAVVVRDIGIAEGVLDQPFPTRLNAQPAPEALLPRQTAAPDGLHKYKRGHVVVVSGPAHRTGAARLGARAALRAGAGLVTVASPPEAVGVNAHHLTAVMVEPIDVPEGLSAFLADKRRNVVLIGPGCGVGAATRRMVEIALGSGAGVVLDADALTSFAAGPEALLEMTRAASREEPAPCGGIAPRAIMTPHEGEFARLFPHLEGSKLMRAREAARLARAIVVLKGPDTVIADPNGFAAISDNAPSWLATAGSGDVLAGLVAGLLGQGLSAFEAASAAVWLHGACANVCGPGLIAEDLPEALPRVLAGLVS